MAKKEKEKEVRPQERAHHLNEMIVARLNQVKPRSESNGSYEVCMSDEHVFADIRHVLTTGIEPFDELTGGLPFGRIVEIFGLDSSAKTALVTRCAVRAQQGHIYRRVLDEDDYRLERLPQTHHPEIVNNGNTEDEWWDRDYDVSVLYIDNEHSLTQDAKIRVDGTIFKGVVARCDTVDMIFKQVDEVLGLLEKEREKSDREQFLIVIVDTVAATNSKEELGREWGKEDYPRQPKQLKEGFRYLISRISRFNALIICTNQVGDNVKTQGTHRRLTFSTPQVDDFNPFGGKALKYWASTRIWTFKVRNYSLRHKSQFPSGFLVGFVTAKNRLQKPVREGRMALMFARTNRPDDDSGGLSNVYSKLETLISLKYAEVNEDREIVFKFRGMGLEPTTFTEPEQEEEQPRRTRRKLAYKEPRIVERIEWPEFYAAHKADFDVMWKTAIRHALMTEEANSDEAAQCAESGEEETPERIILEE